jgi:two-component system response regulator
MALVDKTVLLVDDNSNDVELLKYACTEIKCPYNLVVAQDGQEAIEYLWAEGKFAGRNRDVTPILVILDLKMPRVDGWEVLRRIRADRWLKYLTVMILTSSDVRS